MSYQVNWEIQALDQTAGFLRADPAGVAALWDTISQLAGEPRPPESFPYGSPDLRLTRPLLVLVLDLSNRYGRVEEARLSDELAGRQRGCRGSEEPAIQAGDPHDLDQSRAR